jgi:hypothetical protein
MALAAAALHWWISVSAAFRSSANLRHLHRRLRLDATLNVPTDSVIERPCRGMRCYPQGCLCEVRCTRAFDRRSRTPNCGPLDLVAVLLSRFRFTQTSVPTSATPWNNANRNSGTVNVVVASDTKNISMGPFYVGCNLMALAMVANTVHESVKRTNLSVRLVPLEVH